MQEGVFYQFMFLGKITFIFNDGGLVMIYLVLVGFSESQFEQNHLNSPLINMLVLLYSLLMFESDT